MQASLLCRLAHEEMAPSCRGGDHHGRDAMTAGRWVSVAMAVYNGERFIAEQLESLRAQTWLPNELVVSDDCSTDRTVDLVHTFKARSPFPVRVLRHERNQGVNANFDRAVAECIGDIIFMCDQDDVWLPNKIERTMKAFISNTGAGLVVSNSELVDSTLRPMGARLYRRKLPSSERCYARGARAVGAVLAAGLAFGHTMAFRRTPLLLRPAREASVDYAQDVVRAIIAAAFSDVVVLPYALTKYRRHPEQVSSPLDVSPSRLARLRNALLRAEEEAQRRARFARAMPQLCDKLSALGADTAVRQVLAGRAEVAEFGASLSPSRASRVLPVLRNLLSGRYHRYANGLSTAIRDIVSPALRRSL